MAVVALKTPKLQPQIAAVDSISALESRLQKQNLLKTPIDIEEVAEFLGLEICLEIMDKDLSGYLEYKNGRWIIGVNALHHEARRRFTIAHEIAHFILHGSTNAHFVDQTFARRNDDPSPMEREADSFAAQLLMPEKSVRKAISEGKTSLQELANDFGVSALAMKYRVRGLGFNVR